MIRAQPEGANTYLGPFRSDLAGESIATDWVPPALWHCVRIAATLAMLQGFKDGVSIFQKIASQKRDKLGKWELKFAEPSWPIRRNHLKKFEPLSGCILLSTKELRLPKTTHKDGPLQIQASVSVVHILYPFDREVLWKCERIQTLPKGSEIETRFLRCDESRQSISTWMSTHE
ncbi:hypothetical protein CIRG_01272 [Coccidioides immitis RMSCC 2394]|uniref:Uncharacterized protein n=1 Tax=Coccidioides immitis RMSCC 2394 TaxID=404692 RepID=A0A0J7AUY0_COCIT|nr:hypothetical protein CIRG_01272 [Coccidioides immitis RMSCC 2394]